MVRAGEAPSCAKCVTLAEGLQDGTETVQQRRGRSRGRTADTPSGEAWGGEGRGEGSAHTYCEPVGGTRVPAGPPTPASSGRPRLQPPCARSLPRSLAPGEVAKQNPPSPAPRPSPTLFPESERRRRRRRRQQEAPPAKFNPHPSLPACQRAHTRRKLHAECKTSSEQDFFALKKKKL